MTLQRTSLLTVGLVVVAVLLLVTLGGGTTAGRPDADGRLDITLETREFDVDHLVLPANTPLTLRFENRGDVQHVLAFGRDTLQEGGHPAAPAVDMLDGVSVQAEPADALQPPTDDHPYTGFVVDTGETVTLQFTLPDDRAGEWTLGCFTARGCYYETGFRADVTVE